MSAFAQTTTGDLDISSGNLSVETNVAQLTAWKLTNELAFFKGEWFMDQRQGVPYFQYVFVSNPNLGLISNMFRDICLSVPGVGSVAEVNLDYIPAQRNLTVSIVAYTNEGVKLVGGVGQPFIVHDLGSG